MWLSNSSCRTQLLMDRTSRKATCVQVALARASSLRAHRLDLIGWATARPLHISGMARAFHKKTELFAQKCCGSMTASIWLETPRPRLGKYQEYVISLRCVLRLA